MTERGQHTRIIIGAASAEVALHKTSSKPREAKHDTQRVTVDTGGKGGKSVSVHVPVGNANHAEHDPTAIEPDENPFDEFLREDHVKPGDFRKAFVGQEEEQTVPPTTIVQQGVRLEDGTFVDLTSELAAIDKRTRIEGMRIEFTLSLTELPRLWIRDAYYIVPTSPDAAKFLTYVWEGLTGPTQLVAIVRWTKRTDQYLCAIVPRGSCLALFQLEWFGNMKQPPESALLGHEIPDSGKETAREAMESLRRAQSALEGLRDERTTQRAELLQAARTGKRWVEPEPVTTASVAEALGDILVHSGL